MSWIHQHATVQYDRGCEGVIKQRPAVCCVPSLALLAPFAGDSATICDLVCACILEQLRMLDTVKEKPDFSDILRPFPKVCE